MKKIALLIILSLSLIGNFTTPLYAQEVNIINLSPLYGDTYTKLSEINKYIDQNPNDYRAYNTRALLKDKLKDYNGALQDYATSIALCPDYPTPYFNRGELYYYRLKNDEKALSDFNAAISLGYPSKWPYINRGQIRQSYGDIVGALNDYNTVISGEYANVKEGTFYNSGAGKTLMHVESDDIDTDMLVYFYAASCYMDLNDYMSAIKYATKSIEYSETLDLYNPNAYFIRALALFNIDEIDEGLNNLNKALYVCEQNDDEKCIKNIKPYIDYYSER